jgi:hypothetical protein
LGTQSSAREGFAASTLSVAAIEEVLMSTPAHTQTIGPRRSFGRRRALATAGLAVAAFGVAGFGALGGAGAIASPASGGAGSVQLREGVGTTTCFSTGPAASPGQAAACDRINDLGAATDQSAAGPSTSTTVTVTNVGSVDTSAASLAAGACSATAARDDNGFVGADRNGFCGTVDVTIANTTPGAHYRCLFPDLSVDACAAPDQDGTLARLAGSRLTDPGLSTLAAGGSATYVITVRSDPSQTNADQGLTASLPLTWTISQ